jgi:phage baseplate assembly protein W
MFNCPHTLQIWQRLNVQGNQRRQVIQEVITDPRGTRLHRQEWGTILIAVTWNLWLARNRKVLDNIDHPIQRIQANCLETITLWAHRSRKAESRQTLNDWAATRRRNQTSHRWPRGYNIHTKFLDAGASGVIKWAPEYLGLRCNLKLPALYFHFLFAACV